MHVYFFLVVNLGIIKFLLVKLNLTFKACCVVQQFRYISGQIAHWIDFKFGGYIHWDSPDMISLRSCSTKFLLWLFKQFPPISLQISHQINLKLERYNTLIKGLLRHDKLLVILHWILLISWAPVGPTVSTHKLLTGLTSNLADAFIGINQAWLTSNHTPLISCHFLGSDCSSSFHPFVYKSLIRWTSYLVDTFMNGLFRHEKLIVILWRIFTRGQFWPPGIVVACVCVYQSLACPHDNSSSVQARITKFGPEKQNTLVKIPIVLGRNLPWPSRSNFTSKHKIDPILSLSKPLLTTFYLGFPNLDHKCI